ncbi:glutamine--tRNA ligase/YqeY domain fusion protein [Aureibacter tunicatorum]|uniref:Glutamine--tRNA ligase n=1 Tax=Aureibacter tunicatorum TaxID=866807 RepID=A0AAE3XMX0_9BACT|nr:glutamine--tRNA ligase/YqeY domain fusion protein [Aureibacter tunicatorum]MDR6239435.1 glutaminyl-tRNA synthetase [Aureibacter tunicatorum]BDD04642.1 glutamine--tRNA ligase [Aureibacter tunicatorum]
MTKEELNENKESLNFLEEIIEEDLKTGVNKGQVVTRFPPEPNGFLHIGHLKAIFINFSVAQKYGGKTFLRFDDTNPTKEETAYVEAIKKDIQWLGYQWEGEAKFTSDYFDQLYEWAILLIKNGKAYVDEQTAEEIAIQKANPTVPGIESPYRNRPVEESLTEFEKMKNGEYDEGSKVLRAKIDMTSSNMHMRDPIMYRVMKASHHRTGDKWNIYPMYDWAHGQSDYLEGITNSMCSLEFEVHRPLYDWFLDQVYDENKIRTKQREFSRLNLNYTVMSKRKLLKLVEQGVVSGWDDPRMPTISALRRRGYTPEALKAFAEKVGVTKRENIIDLSLLEFCIREDLNKNANRVFGVLDPVKVIIDNYPEGETEVLKLENNPEDENAGERAVPFGKEIYIEREDFMEQAPNRKYFRLALDKEVRLKGAYIIKAVSVDKDEEGNITAIHCEYDADSKSGSGTEASKRKVKGTLHWVDAKHAVDAEVRIYDRLFNSEAPDSDKELDFTAFLNPDSLQTVDAKVEPSLKEAKVGDRFQFQRLGYFNVDIDSSPEKMVFNRTVTLKDSWAKKGK